LVSLFAVTAVAALVPSTAPADPHHHVGPSPGIAHRAGPATFHHHVRGHHHRLAVLAPGLVDPYLYPYQFAYGDYVDPLLDPFWPTYRWIPSATDPWWYGPNPAFTKFIPPDQAVVELHVKQAKATLVVDGNILGEARDYDSSRDPLWLKAGRHRLELRYRGYQTLSTELDLHGGQAYQLHYRLAKQEPTDTLSR